MTWRWPTPREVVFLILGFFFVFVVLPILLLL